MRAVEEPLTNAEHVLSRYLGFHEHELADPLMPVMNALVVTRAICKLSAKHLLEDDIARLHKATMVAHTCAGVTRPGIVVCVNMTITVDTKHSVARSICRARVNSKPSTVIVSESAVHVRLLSVRLVHCIRSHVKNSENVLQNVCLFPRIKQAHARNSARCNLAGRVLDETE